jgi:hypothetical protein
MRLELTAITCSNLAAGHVSLTTGALGASHTALGGQK